MSSVSTPRQANIELMRIFAMFLIVVWHIKGHYMEGTDIFHPLVMKAMNFTSQIISFHVDLFILITGYFGIRNNRKAIIKNLMLCAIYLWAFNLVTYINSGCSNIQEILFPVTHCPWWFMKVYFMLVLTAPFMERMFATFDKRNWYSWIATLLILNVYFGHYHHVSSVYLMGFDLMNMLTLYSIGTILRQPSLYEKYILGGGQEGSIASAVDIDCFKVGSFKSFLPFGLVHSARGVLCTIGNCIGSKCILVVQANNPANE